MNGQDLMDCGISEIVPLGGAEKVRGKIIENQTLIVLNQLSKNEDELPSNLETNIEINDINYLIEKCQRNTKFYTTTTELNIDTQEAFDEYIGGMEVTKDELQAELTSVSKRLANAKVSFNYILEKYWPENQEAVRSILKELEEASSAENEEDKYREVSHNSKVGPALLLLESLCIVPHPKKAGFFKLAPLI